MKVIKECGLEEAEHKQTLVEAECVGERVHLAHAVHQLRRQHVAQLLQHLHTRYMHMHHMHIRIRLLETMCDVPTAECSPFKSDYIL